MVLLLYRTFIEGFLVCCVDESLFRVLVAPAVVVPVSVPRAVPEAPSRVLLMPVLLFIFIPPLLLAVLEALVAAIAHLVRMFLPFMSRILLVLITVPGMDLVISLSDVGRPLLWLSGAILLLGVVPVVVVFGWRAPSGSGSRLIEGPPPAAVVLLPIELRIFVLGPLRTLRRVSVVFKGFEFVHRGDWWHGHQRWVEHRHVLRRVVPSHISFHGLALSSQSPLGIRRHHIGPMQPFEFVNVFGSVVIL